MLKIVFTFLPSIILTIVFYTTLVSESDMNVLLYLLTVWICFTNYTLMHETLLFKKTHVFIHSCTAHHLQLTKEHGGFWQKRFKYLMLFILSAQMTFY